MHLPVRLVASVHSSTRANLQVPVWSTAVQSGSSEDPLHSALQSTIPPETSQNLKEGGAKHPHKLTSQSSLAQQSPPFATDPGANGPIGQLKGCSPPL